MTTVSVLLPVFNREPFLRQAIESILAQSFAEFELLILDDGSTDASLGTIKSLTAVDPRIRFESRANRGLVATLNELLDKAKGDFIARMDADDVAAPERFARQSRPVRSGGMRGFWPAEEPMRVCSPNRLRQGDSISHRQASRQREAHFRPAAAAAERRGSAPPALALRELLLDHRNSIESAPRATPSGRGGR